MDKKSVFETLNSIDCSKQVEKKNGLTYLSWAWAWGIAKKYYPSTTAHVYERTDANGNTVNYFTDGRTAYVKVGVTIEGQEQIEQLPVMDFTNASIPLDKITSFDVNKAIQRCKTKALALHGLGLYIYAGEDLPEDAKEEQERRISSAIAEVNKANSNDELLKVWNSIVDLQNVMAVRNAFGYRKQQINAPQAQPVAPAQEAKKTNADLVKESMKKQK